MFTTSEKSSCSLELLSFNRSKFGVSHLLPVDILKVLQSKAEVVFTLTEEGEEGFENKMFKQVYVLKATGVSRISPQRGKIVMFVRTA